MKKKCNKADIAWSNAEECNCKKDDCNPKNHRKCYLKQWTKCNGILMYCAHESNLEQKNSKYRWNVDHIEPESKGGANNKDNLKAVHVLCNQKKGNK